MPRSAKTTMKRKRRKMREMIDFMEFIRETTRFLRDAQYLDNHTITQNYIHTKNSPRSTQPFFFMTGHSGGTKLGI